MRADTIQDVRPQHTTRTSPDRVACGDTPDEARTLIAEAVQLHVASPREHGEPVPAPAALTAVVHAA